MDFLNEYKDLLRRLLNSDDSMEEAALLIDGFHKSGTSPDADALYLEAVYHYYKGTYVLALFYADMAYKKDNSYYALPELLYNLVEYSGDMKDYIPTFTEDVSSYERKRTILMYEGVIPIIDYTVHACEYIFKALGHEVLCLKVDKNDKSKSVFDLLLKYMTRKIDFAFIFNNLGLNIKFGDESYYDVAGMRVYNYLFDHPMAFYDSLDNPPQNMILTCVDKKHVEYVERYYDKVKKVIFFPLGSEEYTGSDSMPWKERPVEALYVGSLKVADAAFDDDFSKYVYEYMLKRTYITTEEAIKECYISCDEQLFIKIFGESALLGRTDISDEDIKLIIQKYRFVDLNVNSFFRRKLVEVLIDNEIHVDVYGNGWNYPELLNNPYFHYKGVVPQEECLRQMKMTKFVLNSMPWFKDGAHDRVYNAMLAGALCVTDKSKFLTDEFKDGEDILFYDLDAMNRIPDILRYYDNHPEEAENIAKRGYEQVTYGHTWQRRIIDMLMNDDKTV